MSVIIAIKDKDRFVLGADTQASVLNDKKHGVVKIWEVGELPNAVMGGVGALRANQLIQFNKIIQFDEIKDEIDTAYIVNSVAPRIAKILMENGVNCLVPDSPLDGDMTINLCSPNCFIFAFGNRAWSIGHDFAVFEIEDFEAIGSGAEIAKGVLYATPSKDPFERIATCIGAAAHNTLYVDDNVDFLTTKYYKSDDKCLKKLSEFSTPKAEKVNKDLMPEDDTPVEAPIEEKISKKVKNKFSK